LPIFDPDLVYLDESLLVVNKPAGLLSVPGRGAEKQDCLASRIQILYPDALVVHRLDMATSGLIIFARGPEMQKLLSQMFRDRQIKKHYVAVVSGQVEPPSGEINLPIAADWPNRPRHKIDTDSGKPSLTRYRLLTFDNEADTSHIVLEPLTGRTHQLRLHMAAIGHPILGDALYKGRPENRLFLHASRLCFSDPVNNQPLTLQSDSPF